MSLLRFSWIRAYQSAARLETMRRENKQKAEWECEGENKRSLFSLDKSKPKEMMRGFCIFNLVRNLCQKISKYIQWYFSKIQRNQKISENCMGDDVWDTWSGTSRRGFAPKPCASDFYLYCRSVHEDRTDTFGLLTWTREQLEHQMWRRTEEQSRRKDERREK